MFYQQKKLQIGRYSTEFLPLIITLIGIIFLIALGCWQLYRLQEKSAFIISISNNLNNPPVTYDSKNLLEVYQKIKLTGEFLSDKDIYLYGRKASEPAKEGYYLLSPFKTLHGEVIMVARGWFAAKNKPLISATNQASQTEITGVVLPLEKQKIFIPNNDLKNNVWFTLEHQQMMDYAQTNIENFYLLQIEPENLPTYILPINADNLIKIKNDHLEYALTWFCLAICLGVIFVIYNKQRDKS